MDGSTFSIKVQPGRSDGEAVFRHEPGGRMTVGPDPDGGEWRAPEPTEVIELPARGVGRRVIVRYAEENPWTADGAVFD